MKNAVKNLNLRIHSYALPIALFIILMALLFFTFEVVLEDKYYPLTYVGNTNISFLTKGQAIRKVQASFQKRANQKLSFNSSQGQFSIDLATASAALDYSALDEAFKKSHSNKFTFFLIAKITPQITFTLDKQLNNIASVIDKMPQNAQLIFDETPSQEGSPSARIQIKDGQDGLVLDRESLQKKITDYLLFGKYHSTLPLKMAPPKITTTHVVKVKQVLETLLAEPVKLIFEEKSWILDVKQTLALLDLETGQELLDKNKTSAYLAKIAAEIDSQVQEGLFEFNPQTKRVTAFQASQEGRKLDREQAYQMITSTLTNQSTKIITLPVAVVKPKIATSDVNSLGIKELIGQGISRFSGSIPNRIYNINLTAQKINGVLVAPGEIFSFNATVGDITEATGFRKAYVIKEGRTVLDDGGGVCQDSTTLFRAVLNAGLPVVARTAHAYRVGYYEQGFPPGLDATVFYPSVDFQFKNDTPTHILIQAYTAGNTLFVDLYGTSDNRVATISKSLVSNQTPPPADLRQDDPTLPKGEVKQVDWSAWGADVSFQRTVLRNGQEIIKETWRSSYKPWQAVYLVGTKE